MNIPRDAYAPRLQTVRIIWIALTLGAVVYVGFGIGLPLYILPEPLLSERAADAVRLVAVIGSLVIGVVAIWWRRRSLTADALVADAATTDALFQRFHVALLVSWALTDVIAILGMASAMIGHDPAIALVLGGAAVLLQLFVHRPPTDALDEALRRHRLGVR